MPGEEKNAAEPITEKREKNMSLENVILSNKKRFQRRGVRKTKELLRKKKKKINAAQSLRLLAPRLLNSRLSQSTETIQNKTHTRKGWFSSCQLG